VHVQRQSHAGSDFFEFSFALVVEEDWSAFSTGHDDVEQTVAIVVGP
jgi:hypothetical protein